MMNLSICDTSVSIRLFLLAKYAINIIRVIIPIILIIISSIDIFKTVISGKFDDLKSSLSIIFKRIIAGFIVFLAPTFLLTVFEIMVNFNNESKDTLTCYKSASLAKYNSVRKEEIKKQEEEREKNKKSVNESLLDRHEKDGVYTDARAAERAANATSSTYSTNAENGSSLGGLNMKALAQTDPKWAEDTTYGERFANIGCGPTSLAVIVNYLKGTNYTPPEVGKYVTGFGTEGSSEGGLSAGASHYGVNIEQTTYDQATIIKALKEGHPIMLHVGLPYPHTTGGHYTVASGVTSDGKIIVTETVNGQIETYDPAFIVSCLKGSGALIFQKK